jgi:hypothetical protein
MNSYFKYKIEPDKLSISVGNGKAALPNILRTDHRQITRRVQPDSTFNRGVRRHPMITVTGDLPRFALLRTFPEPRLDPDLIKLGDGRVRISYDGISMWLDELEIVHTVFHPGVTVHRMSTPSLPGLDFELRVSGASDWGITARLEIASQRPELTDLQVEWFYGGLWRCPRTFSAAYFPIDPEDGESNRLAISPDGVVLFQAKDIPGCVAAMIEPGGSPVTQGGKAIFPQDLRIEPGQKVQLFFAAGYGETAESTSSLVQAAAPETLLREAEQYYRNVLALYAVDTPNPVLDAGFLTSVWNLDSAWAETAWLEGVHWWSAYWTNLFQISAAISLGQVERARKALYFFSQRGFGAVSASGEGIPGEDGLPYYLYEL